MDGTTSAIRMRRRNLVCLTNMSQRHEKSSRADFQVAEGAEGHEERKASTTTKMNLNNWGKYCSFVNSKRHPEGNNRWGQH